MKEILDNIFRSPATVTIYATVSARISATRYEITDQNGRVSYAESPDWWPVGVAVVVQNGRIVGRGTLAGSHRVYEV